MSFQEQIISALESNPAISSVVGNRIYSRFPLQEQSGAYICFTRPGRVRQIASNGNRITFRVFSKDLSELEDLSENLLNFFEDRLMVGTDEYFKISLLNQSDVPEILDNGFYFNILFFIFSKST